MPLWATMQSLKRHKTILRCHTARLFNAMVVEMPNNAVTSQYIQNSTVAPSWLSQDNEVASQSSFVALFGEGSCAFICAC